MGCEVEALLHTFGSTQPIPLTTEPQHSVYYTFPPWISRSATRLKDHAEVSTLLREVLDSTSRGDLLTSSLGVPSPKHLMASLLPARYMMCRVLSTDPPSLTLSHLDNQSPPLRWARPPQGADLLALVLFDPQGSPPALDENISGSISDTLPPFFHWVLSEISPQTRHLDVGVGGRGVSVGGKRSARLPHGVEGLNDYSSWFKSSPFKGEYGGYDGPCLIGRTAKTPRSLIALLLALAHPSEPSPTGPISALKDDTVFPLTLSDRPSPKRARFDAPLNGQQLLSKSLDHMIAYTAYRWQVTPLRDR